MTNPADKTAAALPLSDEQRLELANQLYREYQTRCFWHCRRDLVITEELIPLVIAGLRKHGGRRGFILSAQLRRPTPTVADPTGEPDECR